jgi:ferric-dicitrate binding protein FerR (iron transport regulator)
MQQNIEEMKAWKRDWIPFSGSRSARLIAHTQHYHDELLCDIGANPLRKTGVLAPLKELIVPYEPKDYASLLSEAK